MTQHRSLIYITTVWYKKYETKNNSKFYKHKNIYIEFKYTKIPYYYKKKIRPKPGNFKIQLIQNNNLISNIKN